MLRKDEINTQINHKLSSDSLFLITKFDHKTHLLNDALSAYLMFSIIFFLLRRLKSSFFLLLSISLFYMVIYFVSCFAHEKIFVHISWPMIKIAINIVFNLIDFVYAANLNSMYKLSVLLCDMSEWMYLFMFMCVCVRFHLPFIFLFFVFAFCPLFALAVCLCLF